MRGAYNEAERGGPLDGHLLQHCNPFEMRRDYPNYGWDQRGRTDLFGDLVMARYRRFPM